jgi:hypothetical protein
MTTMMMATMMWMNALITKTLIAKLIKIINMSIPLLVWLACPVL